ncbi:MAG: SPOR domain-containing protein, partial [Gammaproteobacteria bacterium]|nr:SPOR domain-containing protein [Gammaproteobacteria bacterium]
MAARRGKSQARRNHGNGLPGWAWMVLGIVLTIGAILAAPRFLKSDGHDGFFRPRPNPDAQPAAAAADDDDAIVPDGNPDTAARAVTKPRPAETQYDFYTLLPGEEVALSDAELAASARAEAQREAQAQRAQAQQAAAQTAQPATPAAPASSPAATAAAPVVAAEPVAADEARYILQAGAFQASGDAEQLKARIALLGLSARVESAQINGKTMYRVRMGPYGTASELADAKRKLGNGGLP